MNKKILIINDSESLSEILTFYLEQQNYQVTVAKNGLEGLEKAARLLPDLILLDVLMPKMSGFEVCLQLKNQAATADIPVLFLSSLTDTEDKVKGLACGGVDFINNMTDPSEMLARIDTHLKIRELTHKLQTSNQELLLKQQALAEDLDAAANIQRSLLPSKDLFLPPSIGAAWSCEPCQGIGGDICNIIAVPEKPYLIAYILDVSGHGVPSAMVTVAITQYFHQLHRTCSFLLSPKEVLERLNREYSFEKYHMFFTCCYLLLNTESGELVYCNAGHPPPIHLKANKTVEWFETTAPLGGVQKQGAFEECQIQLNSGDKLLLYTDGVTEYRNRQGDFFGELQLASILEKCKLLPPQELMNQLLFFIKEFGKNAPPTDDMSLLVIEYKNRSFTHTGTYGTDSNNQRASSFC